MFRIRMNVHSLRIGRSLDLIHCRCAGNRSLLYSVHKPRYITTSYLISTEGSSFGEKGAEVRELMNFYLNVFIYVSYKELRHKMDPCKKDC